MGQPHTCAWKQQLWRAEAQPQRRLGLAAASWDARAGSWDPPAAGDTSRVRPSLNCVTLFTTAARWPRGSLSAVPEDAARARAAAELAAAEALCTSSCRMTALHSTAAFKFDKQVSGKISPSFYLHADSKRHCGHDERLGCLQHGVEAELAGTWVALRRKPQNHSLAQLNHRLFPEPLQQQRVALSLQYGLESELGGSWAASSQKLQIGRPHQSNLRDLPTLT